MPDLISIIIPTYLGDQLLDDCLNSITATSYADKEVVVIDHCPNRLSVSKIKQKYASCPFIHFIRIAKTIYYVDAINEGISRSKGNYIFLLNDDATLESHCLEELLKPFLSDKTIGAIHPKILKYDNHEIDTVGGSIDRCGFSYKQKVNNNEKVFYANMGLFRKSLLDLIGPMDEDFVMYWEDVDLCWRIHLAGFKIQYVPTGIIYHKISQTTKLESSAFAIFHIRKNRLMGLMKYYSLPNVFLFIPLLILIYIALSVKELVIQRNVASCLATYKAIFWNTVNIHKTLQKRITIQKHRVITDRNLQKIMI